MELPLGHSIVRIPHCLRKHVSLCNVEELVLYYNTVLSDEYIQLLLDCSLSIAQHKFVAPDHPPRFTEADAIDLFVKFIDDQTPNEQGSEFLKKAIQVLREMLTKWDPSLLSQSRNSKSTNRLCQIDLSGLTPVQKLECVLEGLIRYKNYMLDDHIPTNLASEMITSLPLFFAYLLGTPIDTFVTKESLFLHATTSAIVDFLIDRFHTEHFIKRSNALISNLNREVPQLKACTTQEELAKYDLHHGIVQKLNSIPDANAYMPNLVFIYMGDYERVGQLFKYYTQTFSEHEGRSFQFGNFEDLATNVLHPITEKMKRDFAEYDHLLIVYLSELFQKQNLSWASMCENLGKINDRMNTEEMG